MILSIKQTIFCKNNKIIDIFQLILYDYFHNLRIFNYQSHSDSYVNPDSYVNR